MSSAKVIWTKVDEAPALATCSLLPIVRAYAKGTGVEFDTHDISLAGRIIATFPDRLREDQQIPDELTWLGELARTPVANIIKLPNISASIPQLQAAITELQAQGYDIPDYPVEPKGDAEQALPRLRQRLHDRRVEDALPPRQFDGRSGVRCDPTAESCSPTPRGSVPLHQSSISRSWTPAWSIPRQHSNSSI